MPNMMGRVFTALSNGAEVKQVKGVGYIVIDKEKRTRRSKEDMAKAKKDKDN